MDFATAAPIVEKAEAAPAPFVDSARVETVSQAEPVRVNPAPRVPAATTVDNPRLHAPPSVMNAVTQSVQQAQQKLGVEAFRTSAPNGRLDFESYAAVIHGGPQKNFLRRFLPFIFEERDFVAYGEVKSYIAVSGRICMVYTEKTSLQPLYAIDLSKFTAILEDRDHPDPESFTISPEPDTNKPRPTIITILLKTQTNHKQAYQFSFETEDDRTQAKRFLDVVQHATSSSKKEEDLVVEGVIINENERVALGGKLVDE